MADDGWLLPRQSVGKKIGAGASRPLWAAPRGSLKPEDIVTPGPASPEFLNWFWRLKLQDYQVGHMKTMATKSWSDMDKESFRLKRINIGVCSVKHRERLEPNADDVPPPLDRYASPVALACQHRAFWTVTGMSSSIGVSPCLPETWRRQDRPDALNWDRFRSIASAQYARKESLGVDPWSSPGHAAAQQSLS